SLLFQAEDGIRDKLVTGVQTCALPIWLARSRNTQGLWVNESTQRATMSVTRVAVSNHPKIEAAATMNITVAVVSIVSIETFTSRSEEHTSELQSLAYLVCRLLLEKKKK